MEFGCSEWPTFLPCFSHAKVYAFIQASTGFDSMTAGMYSNKIGKLVINIT